MIMELSYNSLILLLFILGLLLIIDLFLIIYCFKKQYQFNKQLTYFKCLSRTPGTLLDELFEKNNITRDKNEGTSDIYLPCTYTWVERELNELSPSQNQKIFGITGCDSIVAKNRVWKLLENKYGRTQASKLMPESYVVFDLQDMALFYRTYIPGKLYIMKKNIQRQLGLKLTSDWNQLKNAKENGYVIIQNYINNPFLIDRRKFDMRVYLLVVCHKGNINYYVHSGGRCHYTSKDFHQDAEEYDIHIPSGYTEDKYFKETHPETLIELRTYLNRQVNGRGDLLFRRIDNLLKKCCKAFTNSLCKNQKYQNHLTFQLFGLDVIINENLRPYLIEINKGPDMTWQTPPEKQYKAKITNDIFELLKVVPKGSDTNNFHELHA